MDRKATIDKLIANGKAFVEADRAFLETRTDDQLNDLLPKETPPAEEKKIVANAAATTPAAKPAAEEPITTVEQLLAKSSPELRESMEMLIANHAAEKEELVQFIHGKTKTPLDELKKIALPTLKSIAAPLRDKKGSTTVDSFIANYAAANGPGAEVDMKTVPVLKNPTTDYSAKPATTPVPAAKI